MTYQTVSMAVADAIEQQLQGMQQSEGYLTNLGEHVEAFADLPTEFDQPAIVFNLNRTKIENPHTTTQGFMYAAIEARMPVSSRGDRGAERLILPGIEKMC